MSYIAVDSKRIFHDFGNIYFQKLSQSFWALSHLLNSFQQTCSIVALTTGLIYFLFQHKNLSLEDSCFYYWFDTTCLTISKNTVFLQYQLVIIKPRETFRKKGAEQNIFCSTRKKRRPVNNESELQFDWNKI